MWRGGHDHPAGGCEGGQVLRHQVGPVRRRKITASHSPSSEPLSVAGRTEVFIESPGASPAKVATYAAGHSFGELALMYSAPRAATVVAKIPTAVWTISGQLFRSVLQRGAIEQ